MAGKESLATSILSNMKVKSMEKHEEQKPLDDMPVGEPRERFGMKLLWHRQFSLTDFWPTPTNQFIGSLS